MGFLLFRIIFFCRVLDIRVPEDMETDGVDAIAGSSIVVAEGEVMGNVEYMAAIIQETLGEICFKLRHCSNIPWIMSPWLNRRLRNRMRTSVRSLLPILII